jgi:hypothetical protein
MERSTISELIQYWKSMGANTVQAIDVEEEELKSVFKYGNYII